MLFVVKVRDILVRMIDVGERQVKTDAFREQMERRMRHLKFRFT